jgi:hypothetical protein
MPNASSAAFYSALASPPYIMRSEGLTRMMTTRTSKTLILNMGP